MINLFSIIFHLNYKNVTKWLYINYLSLCLVCHAHRMLNKQNEDRERRRRISWVLALCMLLEYAPSIRKTIIHTRTGSKKKRMNDIFCVKCILPLCFKEGTLDEVNILQEICSRCTADWKARSKQQLTKVLHHIAQIHFVIFIWFKCTRSACAVHVQQSHIKMCLRVVKKKMNGPQKDTEFVALTAQRSPKRD